MIRQCIVALSHSSRTGQALKPPHYSATGTLGSAIGNLQVHSEVHSEVGGGVEVGAHVGVVKDQFILKNRDTGM